MMNEVIFWDLETVGLSYTGEDDRIISCATISNNETEPNFFIIDDLSYESECKLLKEILDHLLKYNVWCGFSSDSFDSVVLFTRLSLLLPDVYEELDIFKYYAFNYTFNRRELRYILKGTDMLDYLKLVKFFKFDNLPNHKLNTVAKFYLDDVKLDLNNKLPIELYNSGYLDELKEYNIKDITLLKDLEDKLGLIKLSQELSDLTGAKLYQCTTTSKLAEAYFDKKGIVLADPNIENHLPADCKNYGGLNYQSDAGVYHNVSVLDYSSLYPSIILAFGLDPEIEVLIRELWDLRSKYKNDKSKYYAIKVILNSFYGYYSYKYSRRYRPQIAALITEYGRDIISFTKDYIEQNSTGKVILQDTDSCYVMQNSLDPEVISKAVNKHFHTKYPLTLELENELESILLVGKKKHYGYLDKSGNYVFKGISAVRGNSYNVHKQLQVDVIKKLLNGENNFKKINQYIDSTIKDASFLDISLPYKIGKDYKNGRSYKAKAVNWSIENLHRIVDDPTKTFTADPGDTVYVIQVKKRINPDIDFPDYIGLSYEMIQDEDFWRYEFFPSHERVTATVKRSINKILDSVGANTGQGVQKTLFNC